MAPLVGTLLRLSGRGGRITDDFNRSVASGLGSTSEGAWPWTVLSGTWSVNGTKAITSTSHSSNPLAVVNPSLSDVDVSLTLGTGDALYFRVQDATNWWRLLWEGYQTSSCSTCCDTCCDTCTSYCSEYGKYCSGSQQGNWCYRCPYPNSSGGCACTCHPGDGCVGYYCQQSCGSYQCNCRSCNCYSCNCNYYNNYRAKVEKMVGGTLSTLYTGGSGSATTRARVVLQGNSVATYYGSGTTSLWSSSQSDLASATRYGVGRGSSSYNTSAIDDFQLLWE